MNVQAPEQKVVESYFRHIRELRDGKATAVQALLDLWNPDGVIEFAGASPVTGSFRGRNALHVFYKNRLQSKNMAVKLDRKTKTSKETDVVDLIESEPQHIRAEDGAVVANWNTVVSTRAGQGFQVAGSHTFTFRGGKIANIRVVVSPQAEPMKDLRIEGLTVDDIGRLSLAAWAIVV